GWQRPWSYHFVTPAAPLQPRSDAAGYHSVCALGPDLMEDARNAVRYTIDWLAKDHGLSREDAYILCSLAGELRISQIVDQPSWGGARWEWCTAQPIRGSRSRSLSRSCPTSIRATPASASASIARQPRSRL